MLVLRAEQAAVETIPDIRAPELWLNVAEEFSNWSKRALGWCNALANKEASLQ